MPGSPRDATTVAAGLGMAAIFGCSFVFTKTALATLSPFDLMAGRFVLAAAAMSALIAAGLVRVRFAGRRWWRLLALAAVQPVAYFICETCGVNLTAASEAGIVIGTIPVAVAAMAAIFLRERPTFVQVLFIVCSFLGVAVMAAGGGDLGRAHLGGLLFLGGAVLSASLYTILSRHLSRDFAPVEITAAMMWTGAAVFGVLAMVRHWAAGSAFPWGALLRPTVWVPLVYLGLLSSVGAFFLVNYMLSRIEAARTVAYTNLTSFVSLVAGVLVLGESFHWYQWAGGFAILLGVWGANRFVRSGPKSGNRAVPAAVPSGGE